MIKICAHCGKEFNVPKYRADSAKFCSRSCLALQARILVRAKCLICGDDFEHISSRSNKAKYCSRQCYYKAMKAKGKTTYTCKHCGKDFLGSKSHKRIYCSMACVNKSHKSEWNPAFSTVRKSLLIRGKINKCENCGYDKHQEILGVHHKDRNRKNNELTNLIVLCPNCHSVEHMKHIPHGFKE